MDAVVVWMTEAPSSASERALEQWAHERGLRIVPPKANTPGLPYAEDSAGAIEALIAQAREAVAQLDAEGAERALARAEGTLRAHPELPQAAWLMAEVHRGWAARFSRVDPRDAARSMRALAAADALDSGRAPGVGEIEGPKPAPIEFDLSAEPDPDVVYLLDAKPVRLGKVSLPAGEHHIVAFAAGQVRWADWITVREGARIDLPRLDPIPCSTEDLGRASRGAVRCPTWISAWGEGSSVRASLCHGSSCESASLFTLRASRWPPVSEVPHARGFRLPGWLVITTLGVLAAGGLIGALAASGVFSPAPHTSMWFGSPPKPE